MRSHCQWFLEAVFWILSSKNNLLVFFMTSLNDFQSSIDFDNLYCLRLAWKFLFYHALDLLVILTHCECLYQISSDTLAYSWTIISRYSLSVMFAILILPIALIRSEMKFFSSLLFLIIVCYCSWMNSSAIEMSTDRGTWSDGYWSSGEIERVCNIK